MNNLNYTGELQLYVYNKKTKNRIKISSVVQNTALDHSCMEDSRPILLYAPFVFLFLIISVCQKSLCQVVLTFHLCKLITHPTKRS